jgi:hypothetical protein
MRSGGRARGGPGFRFHLRERDRATCEALPLCARSDSRGSRRGLSAYRLAGRLLRETLVHLLGRARAGSMFEELLSGSAS